MTTIIKLAFGHKARVGKDTACEYVLKTYGEHRGVIYRFAQPVYAIATLIQKFLGRDEVKDPGLLQLIGLGMREHYGEDIWVNEVDKQIVTMAIDATVAVVPDMRFPNEMALLESRGFVTVNLNRNNRVIDRDPNHPSEIGLDGADYDFTYANDSGKEKLYAFIDYIIAKKFPAMYEARWKKSAADATPTTTYDDHYSRGLFMTTKSSDQK